MLHTAIVLTALVGIYLALCDVLDYVVQHVWSGRKWTVR